MATVRTHTPELPALVAPLDRFGNKSTMQTSAAHPEQAAVARRESSTRPKWNHSSSWARDPGRPPRPSSRSLAEEVESYQSFALYSEVKLKEIMARSSAASRSDSAAPVVDSQAIAACFALLDRAAEETSSLQAPLQGISAALKAAVYSPDVSPAGSGRIPYFEKAIELEHEVERVRKNARQLYGRGEQVKTSGSRQQDSSTSSAPGSLMTESRLMHLESEMQQLVSRVTQGENLAVRLRRELTKKNQEYRDLEMHTVPALKMELKAARVDLERVERLEHEATQKLKKMQLIEGDLGLTMSDARTQIDSLRAEIAELNQQLEVSRSKEKNAAEKEIRLSYRVQELKKMLLQMVPKAEVAECWNQIQSLKEQTAAQEKELALLRSTSEDSPGKDEDLHEMLQYMTPRPDWSKVSQYVDGDLDGLPSTELVARLYRTIDEARGLADEAEWDDTTDEFTGLGKSRDVPEYLHWEGTVRNVHMSKSEVDALAFEILQRKQMFDRKRDKATSLQSYLPTFFREKFGIQARIVEVAYNMFDAIDRFKTDAFLEQFKMALSGELETKLVERTADVPNIVLKILQKEDRSNGGTVSGMLTKSQVLAVLEAKVGSTLTDLSRRIMKQEINSCSKDASIRYDALVFANVQTDGKSSAKSGRTDKLGCRTRLVTLLEEAYWRRRQTFVADFVREIKKRSGYSQGSQGTMIDARTAKECLRAVDPDGDDKSAVAYLTKGFKSALQRGGGKTVERLDDKAKVPVDDLCKFVVFSSMSVPRGGKHSKKSDASSRKVAASSKPDQQELARQQQEEADLNRMLEEELQLTQVQYASMGEPEENEELHHILRGLQQ